MDYLTDAAKVSEAETQKKSAKGKEIFEWLDIIVTSMISVVIIFTFLFRLVTIVGDSMQNSFYGGEKIVITGLFYEPKYGDVVVISRNAHNSALEKDAFAEPIIKRVIATGGQYVDINFNTGVVYVGDDASTLKPLNEPYTKAPTYTKADVDFPVYVPEGYVFVLGDNRNDSKDSRFKEIGENGLVNEKYILGRAVFRAFPFSRAGVIKGVEGENK
ncbi:MAG: signal peptidase I [Clostridia bacterium]|nr:signal peptidase I [Clostridia bacterium]